MGPKYSLIHSHIHTWSFLRSLDAIELVEGCEELPTAAGPAVAPEAGFGAPAAPPPGAVLTASFICLTWAGENIRLSSQMVVNRSALRFDLASDLSAKSLNTLTITLRHYVAWCHATMVMTTTEM